MEPTRCIVRRCQNRSVLTPRLPERAPQQLGQLLHLFALNRGVARSGGVRHARVGVSIEDVALDPGERAANATALRRSGSAPAQLGRVVKVAQPFATRNPFYVPGGVAPSRFL